MNAAVTCLREERRRQRDVLKTLQNDMALKNEDGAYYVRLVRQVRREIRELDAALLLLKAPDVQVPQEPRIPAPVTPAPPVPAPPAQKPMPPVPAPPVPKVTVEAVAEPAPAVRPASTGPTIRPPPRRDQGLVRRVAI